MSEFYPKKKISPGRIAAQYLCCAELLLTKLLQSVTADWKMHGKRLKELILQNGNIQSGVLFALRLWKKSIPLEVYLDTY
ncbi:hypothetical protein A593_13505 [Klebsiella variicola]|nr:hypothetical protein A593_13505 [Klebsiella variicola]